MFLVRGGTPHSLLKTIHLAIGFSLLFAAFFAWQNLITSIYEEDQHGFHALSVVYFSFALSAIFAPALISLMGLR